MEILGRLRRRALASALAVVAAVAAFSGAVPAVAIADDSRVCVDSPVPPPSGPFDQACAYARDWASAGFYLDPGPRSFWFYRVELRVDKFHVPDEGPETVLAVQLETCQRAGGSPPRSGRLGCFGRFYVDEIKAEEFDIDPTEARLTTKFGGHPLEVTWTPGQPTPPEQSGPVVTEVGLFGADAEHKTQAAAVAATVGDYRSCTSEGEFGVGVETDVLGRREVPPGLAEPRRVPELAAPGASSSCGDPVRTLQRVLRARYPYNYMNVPGGALGIHLLAPGGLIAGASYMSVEIDDDTGPSTYGTLLIDQDGDNYLENRHLFCGEMDRPVPMPPQPAVYLVEIQEGPCMYPRLDPLARGTTGTVRLTVYR